MSKLKSRTLWLIISVIVLFTIIQFMAGDKSTLNQYFLSVVSLVGIFTGKSSIKHIKGK